MHGSSLTHVSCKAGFVVLEAILPLSPIDTYLPTRRALGPVTKVSFVSLVTNLINKTMFVNSDVFLS